MGKRKVENNSTVKRNVLLQSEEIKSSRKNNLYLLIVISVGLLIRLAYVIEIHSSPFMQHLFSDSKIYNDWALRILSSGKWFGSDVFFMSPFYPLMLALIYSIIGHSVLLILILQTLVSTAVIFIVYKISKLNFSESIALISALIASLYGMFIFYSGLILSETFMTFFLSLAVLFLLKAEKDNNKLSWLLAGLFLGITIVIRANIIVLFIFILIWLGIRIIKWKNKSVLIFAGYLTLGTIIPILPFTFHNLFASGDFVILTSNGGINFYIGNNPTSQGVYNTLNEFDFNSDMSGKNYAEHISGRQLKPSEVSSFWYNKGLGYITGNFTSAVKLYIIKLFLLFGPNENAQSSIMDYEFYEENFSQILNLPLIPFSLVSYLAILSVYFLWKDKKKYMLLLIFFTSFIISSLPFFVNGRYRLPFTPVLIIMAAFSVEKIFSSFRDKKVIEFRNPIILLIGFILLYTFVVPKPSFNNYDAYNQLGTVAYEAKNYDKAIEYYNKSIAFEDDYETYVNMGNAFAAKKDYHSALAAFQRAINREPGYTLAYFDIGLAHSEMKNYPMAIKAFSKALELDPAFYDAYRNLAIAYYVEGDYKNALQNFQKYYPHIKDDRIRNTVFNDIENLKGLLSKNK